MANNEVVTIDGLIRKKLPIWVLNRTDKLPGKNAAPLFVNLSTKDGVQAIIPIGAPVLLTDQAPAEVIGNSIDLRRLVSEGFVELIDPEESKKFGDKEVQASRGALAAYKRSSRNPVENNIPQMATNEFENSNVSAVPVNPNDKGMARGLTPEQVAALARQGE